MATSYDKCYDAFLSNINDADILYPFEGETDEEFGDRLHNLLFMTFKKAIAKFKFSKTNLSRDDSTEMFDNELRDAEIDIIGLLMLREYYRKQLNFLASLKHSFSDKNWKSHDKSNQMNQYRQILKETNDEIRLLIIDNSYTSPSGELEGWWDE